MFFNQVNEAPPDPIFGIGQAFKADSRENKVNLVVGIYKDEELEAKLLDAVLRAKKEIFNEDLLADYLPIDGLGEMVNLLGPLIFGNEWQKNHSRIFAAHTAGGTAALRVGAEFLAQEVCKSFYVSNHTWPNHRLILEKAHTQCENYPYYNREKKGFDFEAMVLFLEKLKENSIVILHACCHNPTGCDPTPDEWRAISQLMLKKRLFPFFDFAYQGLGDGLEEDAQAIRIFMQDGHEMLIAYSCSKNFSMYCQRVGALFIVSENPAVKLRVGSQVKRIIRALYSNPPAHGAWIVTEVLKKDPLRALWQTNLAAVRTRIVSMRHTLTSQLIHKAKGLDFTYLKSHKGMFSFIDMDKSQVQKIIDEFAIYMTDNGRISIPGLNAKNIDYVVDGLVSVCAKH